MIKIQTWILESFGRVWMKNWSKRITNFVYLTVALKFESVEIGTSFSITTYSSKTLSIKWKIWRKRVVENSGRFRLSRTESICLRIEGILENCGWSLIKKIKIQRLLIVWGQHFLLANRWSQISPEIVERYGCGEHLEDVRLIAEVLRTVAPIVETDYKGLVCSPLQWVFLKALPKETFYRSRWLPNHDWVSFQRQSFPQRGPEEEFHFAFAKLQFCSPSLQEKVRFVWEHNASSLLRISGRWSGIESARYFYINFDFIGIVSQL